MYTRRMTITPRNLVLLSAERAVPLRGPAASITRNAMPAGTAIAEIEASRSWPISPNQPVTEVLVNFLCGDSPDTRRRILEWAGHVGLEQVWFHDAVEEPIAPALDTDAYETNCLVCGQHYAEAGQDFRHGVRICAAFPIACVTCGGPLPQWTELRVHPATGQSDHEPPQPLEAAHASIGHAGPAPTAFIYSDHREKEKQGE